MRTHLSRWLGLTSIALCTVGLLAGCDSNPRRTDAGVEATDSGVDGGALLDAGAGADAGARDAGPRSSGLAEVFRSGFEDGVEVTETNERFGDLVGDDETSPHGDWTRDIDGRDPLGSFRIFYEGGSRAQRDVSIAADPELAGNRVLHTWIGEPNVPNGDDAIACNGEPPDTRKARIQGAFFMNRGLRRLEYQVRVRLGDAFDAMGRDARANHWMTIGEYWNNVPRPGERYPFRITLGLHRHPTAGGGDGLVWILKADQHDDEGRWTHVWPTEPGYDGRYELTSATPVPVGEWVTLRVSLVEGDAASGRVSVRLVDARGAETVLFDVRDATHHPDDPAPNGFEDFQPIKLYTSGPLVCALRERSLPLEAWWDDFVLATAP